MAHRGIALAVGLIIAALSVVAAQTPTPPFPLPAALPEDVPATRDFPYLPPPPGARLLQNSTIGEPLELRQATAEDEAVLAGNAYVRKTYERPPQLAAAAFLGFYRDTLFASGWQLIDVSKLEEIPAQPETVNVAAQYRENGRNIYARVSLEPDGPLQINVADVGAEDWRAALAAGCRLRVHSLHFALDTPDLELAESEPTLRKLAHLLAAPSAPRVEIQGHVDNIGEAGAAARQALSDKRAQSVMLWLTTNGGVPAEKVSAKGYGRSKPIADNDSDLGRALNRRIDVACLGH